LERVFDAARDRIDRLCVLADRVERAVFAPIRRCTGMKILLVELPWRPKWFVASVASDVGASWECAEWAGRLVPLSRELVDVSGHPCD
jgi:hypothetical protein